MIPQEYRIVKRVHNNGVKGYIIQVPWTLFFNLFSGWSDVYEEFETWAGTSHKLAFFKTEEQCHVYMNLQEELKNWK